MTPAGRLDLSLDRALLLAALPTCLRCGAPPGSPCVRVRPYRGERVELHDERVAELREEVELFALARCVFRVAGPTIPTAASVRELAAIRERLHDLSHGWRADQRRLRGLRSAIARLRALVLG